MYDFVNYSKSGSGSGFIPYSNQFPSYNFTFLFPNNKRQNSGRQPNMPLMHNHFRGLQHGQALPAADVWLLCGWPVLQAITDPHGPPTLLLPRRREPHTQRHVDPALPLQQELLQHGQRQLCTCGQPAQRHTHLLSLIIHRVWRKLEFTLFSPYPNVINHLWGLKFASLILHWSYEANVAKK